MLRKPPMSARALLRAFQLVRGGAPDPGFMADLGYLQNRDLDLSALACVRAMLIDKM